MKRESAFGFIAALAFCCLVGAGYATHEQPERIDLPAGGSWQPETVVDGNDVAPAGAPTAIEALVDRMDSFDQSLSECRSEIQRIADRFNDRFDQQEKEADRIADEFLDLLGKLKASEDRLRMVAAEQEQISKQLAWADEEPEPEADPQPQPKEESTPAETEYETVQVWQDVAEPYMASECYMGADGRRYCRQVQRTRMIPRLVTKRVAKGTAAVVRGTAAVVRSAVSAAFCPCGCPDCTCNAAASAAPSGGCWGTSLGWSDQSQTYSSGYPSAGSTGNGGGYTFQRRPALFPRLRAMRTGGYW